MSWGHRLRSPPPQGLLCIDVPASIPVRSSRSDAILDVDEVLHSTRPAQINHEDYRTRDRSRSGSRNRSTENGAHDPRLPSGFRHLTLTDIFDRPSANAQVRCGQRGPTLDLVSSGITDEYRRIANVICRPISDGEAGIEFDVPALCFSDIPSAEPEICAFSWLQDGRVTFPQLRVLFHMLPAAVVKRHQAPHLTCTQDARAIHFGAWVHGGNIGVMNTCRAFPYVVRLLCLVLRTLRPHGKFSTVFLALNVPSGVHTDPHNHEEVENTLVPLSAFKGGDLFVADDHGSIQLEPGGVKGILKPITFPYTSFWARRKHAVMPWSGDRFILGSYHVRNPEWFSQSDRLELNELGVRLLDS